MKHLSKYLLLIFSFYFFHGICEAESLEDYFSRARALVESQKLPSALEILVQASREYPQEAKVWFNLGNIYRDLNRFEEASHAYEKALEIKAEYDTARYNLALVYGILDTPVFNITKAIDELHKLEMSTPDSFLVNYQLGRLYFIHLQSFHTMDYGNKLIKLYPQKAEGYLLLATVYLYKGDQPKALEMMNKASKVDSQNQELRNLFAEYYYEQAQRSFAKGQNQRGMSYCKKALEQNSNHGFICEFCGKKLYEDGKIKECIEIFSRETALDPQNPIGYLYLGKLLIEGNNDFEKALTLAQIGFSLGSARWEVREQVAYIKLMAGDTAKAIEIFQSVLFYYQLNLSDFFTKSDFSEIENLKPPYLSLPPTTQYTLLCFIKKYNARKAFLYWKNIFSHSTKTPYLKRLTQRL